jgi:hypothetical protein
MEPIGIAPHPDARPVTKFVGSSEYTLLKDDVQDSCLLLAQYQATSSLYSGNYSLVFTHHPSSSQITEPMAVFQPTTKTNKLLHS